MTHHYGYPPKGYTPYYDPQPSSPYGNDYVYYAPQHETTPMKKHERKFSYSTAKPGGYYSPPGYPSPNFYEKYPDYTSPPPKDQYVSPTKQSYKNKLRSYSMSGGRHGTHTSRKQEQPIYIHDGVDDAYDIPQQYIHHDPKPKPKPTHTRKRTADQDFYFSQAQVYDEQPKRSRSRRESTTTKSPKKPSKTYTKPPPKATEDDAFRAGIPAGYSIKNWDPTEQPIILLGSVFDANSLGKWIYDWTVFHHGASSPMADVAGDLWLLLIKLAGKRKRAEECIDRIRSIDSQEMVEDFIESGTRLWHKFKQLLKACEHFMWRAARREGSKNVKMGENAGTEFVDSIFGRDRELENTEKLMNSIRLWNMRFDANCEEILRRPSAA